MLPGVSCGHLSSSELGQLYNMLLQINGSCWLTF